MLETPQNGKWSTEDNTRDQMLSRALPHSAEAEQAALGGVILDNKLFDELVELLTADDFYVRAHQYIVRAMIAIAARGGEINPILIGEELRREGVLEQVGGVPFINELTYGLPHFANIAAYAKIIKDKSVLRQLVRVANKVSTEALDEEDEADVILDHAGQMIFALAEQRQTRKFHTAHALVTSNIERAEYIQQSGNRMTGLSTGLNDLDSFTMGLQPTDLIIVAARPSIGKTSLGLTIAQHAAFREDAVVALFSLEMSKEQIADRILTSEAKVDAVRFRAGYLNSEEWARIRQAAGLMAEKRLYVDDTPAITPLQLRSASRRLAAQHKRLDLIVVDYLQLMASTVKGKRADSREQEVSSISRELKGVAKEMKVPLILMSQLNRGPEQRSDHRPLLSDLRESGAIEQDADVVAFIFREEVYGRTEENAGVAELIISKNRNGPTGTVKVAFIKEFTTFANMWRN